MDVRTRFTEIARLPDHAIDLGEASMLIAAEEYPELDVAACVTRLDRLADAVRPRIEAAPAVVERLETLIAFLVRDFGLRGNDSDYYDARNSFLNDVLDRRLGIPISLGIVAMEVGRRVGIELEGVSFPVHFLTRPAAMPGLYVDLYNGGMLLTEDDCKVLLERLTEGKVDFDPRLLVPASKRDILVRVLNNLKSIYLKGDDYTRALSVVDRLLLLAPTLKREYRDRGAIYVQMEAYRNGLRDLERYLNDGVQENERDVIEQTVNELRHRVAMLN